MRAILFAAVVVGIASAADHKFAIGEPASCVVDASGRTIVRYISEVHTSFQCTHTSAGACTCTGQHPTHHKGNCRTFAHLGRVHQVGGDCSGLATAITTTTAAPATTTKEGHAVLGPTTTQRPARPTPSPTPFPQGLTPINVEKPTYFSAGYAVYRVPVTLPKKGGAATMTNQDLTDTCARHNLQPVCAQYGLINGKASPCIQDGVSYKGTKSTLQSGLLGPALTVNDFIGSFIGFSGTSSPSNQGVPISIDQKHSSLAAWEIVRGVLGASVV